MELYTKQVNTCYGRMNILSNDLMIGRSLEQHGEWAQAEVDLLTRILEPGGVAVDIGAFIGTHTLALSRCVGPQGKVYAFEPRPEYFRVLQENIRDHSLGNVEAVQAALSDELGFVDLLPLDLGKPRDFGAQGLYSQEIVGSGDARHVPVTTVDECGFDRCQLLKIDVEGMEPNVLRGAVTTLTRLRPTVYAECLSVDRGWDVVLLMRELEYQPFLHVARCPGEHQPMLLLLPKERSDDITRRLAVGETLLGLPTADDLVVSLLHCPGYWNPVLIGTEAARVQGLDFSAYDPGVPAEVARELARELPTQVARELARELPIQVARELARELEKVYASWSWRMTAPIRAIGRVVHRLS